MGQTVRIAHFLNQFFGGVGGTEAAETPLTVRHGAVGPGRALEAALAGDGEVVGTLVCGDTYFAEHAEAVLTQALQQLGSMEPDILVTGPAFDSGVYGLNCARLGNAVAEALGLPVVSAMFPENPGVDIGRRRAYVVSTGRSTGAMSQALAAMAPLILRLGRGEAVGGPDEAGYLPRGLRLNAFASVNGAERAVEMLLRKVAGTPYRTEIPVPEFDEVAPARPLGCLGETVVAVVTTGGIVPRGNPDRIESRRATRWAKYPINGLDRLSPEAFECIHGGFDGQYANADPNRVVPLDVLRELERAGVIKGLASHYYVTTGNAGPLDRARRFGEEIARDLSAAGVGAVVLTAT
jgi:glycine reductase complex component B subunit gamma